jgi:formate hydrogenlyase transcriptional activator
MRAALLESQRRVLERIASGAPMEEILETLVRLIEEQAGDMRCAVLLADSGQQRLRFVAAPNIPDDYKLGIEPYLRIAPEMGSCGTAAFRREPVYTQDTATDPLWEHCGQIAVRNGLRAIWSTPILSDDNAVLGTFTMYYGEPRLPSPEHIQLIDMATQMARVAIEAKRSKETLLQSEERFRLAIDTIPAMVWTALPDGSVDFVNKRWLEYIGQSREEFQRLGWEPLVHPEDLARTKDYWRTAITAEKAPEIEHRVRRADGQYRWLLGRGEPLRGEDGKIVKWYGAVIDIEEKKRALQEVHALKDQLQLENLALKEEVDQASMFEEIIGSSEALNRVLAHVTRVAPTDSTVLIKGETGTGKELVARAIHRLSRRSGRAFVLVNCAAIPPALIASELFGHEKGAFTGAIQRRLGRFELADGGTIFLDEVGELPAETQSTLLRVLQEREFERVGGSQPISVDVRVIAATNRDLKAGVDAGTFRLDLFYRLNVFPLQVPSLRERVEDIPVLAEYFTQRYAAKARKNIRRVEKPTLKLLQAYPWPGNVRELQNVIERAAILCDGDTLSVDETWLQRESPARRADSATLAASLEDREREMIEAALAESRGRVSGASGAAARLGIARSTLESRIKSLRINKHRFKSR